MTDLFLTRHGETKWNLEGKFQGWGNSELTERGVKLAKNLNRVVRENNIEIIISSPTQRAKITAEYAKGDLNIPIILMDEFKELNLGKWEGRLLKDLEVEYKDNYHNFWHDPYKYETDGGENFKDLIERVNLGLIKVVEQYEGRKILIVTHGMALMAMIHLLLRRDFNEVIKEPVRKQTSITHIQLNPIKNKVIKENDTSHIDDEEFLNRVEIKR